MATLETSGLWLPTDNSLSMGGGPSILTIRVASDYSDVYSGALWNVVPLLESVDISPTEVGGATNQTETLMQNKVVTVNNPNAGNNEQELTIPIVTMFDEGAIEDFLYTRKGWKEFIGIPVRHGAAMKKVFWSYGYWQQAMTRPIAGNQTNKKTLNFVCQKHGLASGSITFPALYDNTDTALDGSEYANEYLGWPLPEADAAKGGIGYAVTVPTITELPGDKLGVVMTYDS